MLSIQKSRVPWISCDYDVTNSLTTPATAGAPLSSVSQWRDMVVAYLFGFRDIPAFELNPISSTSSRIRPSCALRGIADLPEYASSSRRAGAGSREHRRGSADRDEHGRHMGRHRCRRLLRFSENGLYTVEGGRPFSPP